MAVLPLTFFIVSFLDNASLFLYNTNPKFEYKYMSTALDNNIIYLCLFMV